MCRATSEGFVKTGGSTASDRIAGAVGRPQMDPARMRCASKPVQRGRQTPVSGHLVAVGAQQGRIHIDDHLTACSPAHRTATLPHPLAVQHRRIQQLRPVRRTEPRRQRIGTPQRPPFTCLRRATAARSACGAAAAAAAPDNSQPPAPRPDHDSVAPAPAALSATGHAREQSPKPPPHRKR